MHCWGDIWNIHEQVQQLTEKKNAIYKQATDKHHRKMFDLEELVWANLKKERFPVGMYLKLKQKQIGQCKVLQRIKDNAYHSELSASIYIHNIFIIKDLYQLSRRSTGQQLKGEFLSSRRGWCRWWVWRGRLHCSPDSEIHEGPWS